MNLFPFFIDMENKDVLVVGGGEVALRKIEKILPFNPKITVVAKKLNKKIIELSDKYQFAVIKKSFELKDLENRDIVIVALDDIKLQEEIFNFVKDKKILINSVDSPDFCNFIFPAYIKKGDIVIGLTTSGKVPALTAVLRELIENSLPEDIESFLDDIYEKRKSLPKGKERQEYIKNLVKEKLKIYFDKNQ